MSQASQSQLQSLLLSHCDRSIFDESPLGVIETDLQRRVLYANPAALKIFGARDYEGLTLNDTFVVDEARSILERELNERRKGIIGNYRTQVRRLSDKKDIPIDITGIPLVDGAGAVTGALGLFRSLEHEGLAADIRRLTLEHDQPGELLTAVAQRLQGVLPFDVMFVSRYSQDMMEADSHFMYGGSLEKVPKVWYPMTDDQRKYMETSSGGIADFELVINNPPWTELRDEPMVKQLLQAGLKKSMWRVIRAAARPPASISLMTRDPAGFDAAAQKLFNDLPLDEAVFRAMDSDRIRLEGHKLDLLRKLNHQTTVRDACKLLARQLVSMFGWSHVSVFRVDYGADLVRLLDCHWARQDSPDADVNYSQPITDGILGRVVRTGMAQNVGNVANDAEYVNGPHRGTVRSELACPILFENDARVRYIINVDDDRVNAFSRDDCRMLEDMANEVAGVMQRISQVYFLTQCFDTASDPIIVTDAKLQIRKLNPAAAALLGFKVPAEVTGAIGDLFEKPELFLERFNRNSDDLGEMTVARESEDETQHIPVTVTRQEFPEGLGGFVFVARDLRPIRRAVEADFREKAAYEVAVETRTPLSLAMAQLERLAEKLDPWARPELDKVLRQLGRVKHAYTRLAMFNLQVRSATDFSPLHVREELQALLANLADEEQARIEFVAGDQPPPAIMGDHNQVAIVFEGLLSVLLRAAPESDKVTLRVAWDDGAVFVRFLGKLPAREVDLPGRRMLYEAHADLQIANPLIHDIMAAHGGTLTVLDTDSGRKEFTLRFPLGVHHG